MSTGSARLRLAVVGAGIIGKQHAKAAVVQGGYEVAVLVDSDPAAGDAAADLVEGLGVPRPTTAATIPDAAAATHLDLIAICTPSGLHVEHAEQALAAGAHVLIEKPLDTTMPRGRRLAELARTAVSEGRVVSVISQKRLDPAAQLVARTARDGGFGTITSGVASVAWYRDQAYYDSAGWRGTWALDGGAVMNQGIHTLDLLIWSLGRPVEVSATTATLGHDRIEVEDVAVATIRFGSGALGVVHCTTAAYPGLSARLSLFGTRGSAVLDDDRLAYFHVADEDAALRSASTTSGTAAADGAGDQKAALLPAEHLVGGPRESEHFRAGHVRQYADLHVAITEQRPPAVTVDDALLTLATVHALYVSATLGRPVLVDDVLDGRFDDVGIRVSGAAADR